MLDNKRMIVKLRNTTDYFPAVMIGTAILGVVLIVAAKILSFSILLPLFILLCGILGIWLYMIREMVSKGKVKAKGAKKRRKKILPFLYAK